MSWMPLKYVRVHKADGLHDDSGDVGMMILCDRGLPQTDDASLLRSIYWDDAEAIFFALRNSLPQATFRELADIMRDRIRA